MHPPIAKPIQTPKHDMKPPPHAKPEGINTKTRGRKPNKNPTRPKHESNNANNTNEATTHKCYKTSQKNFQKTCNKHLTTNDKHDIVNIKTQHTTTKMLLDTIIKLPAHVEQQRVTRLTSVVVPGQSGIHSPPLKHPRSRQARRGTHRT